MSDRKTIPPAVFWSFQPALPAAVAAALADPPHAAAQSAGVKKADLPDLTIKEVKVYVADVSSFRRLNSGETGEILSVVTNGGHEGNYTIGNRSLTPNWLEWAKPALLGKNVIDLLPAITATTGTKETFGFSGGATGAPGGGRGAAAPAAHRAARRAGGSPPSFGTPNRVAAPGPTTTPPRPKSACGTFSAKPSIAPSTRSWAARKTA